MFKFRYWFTFDMKSYLFISKCIYLHIYCYIYFLCPFILAFCKITVYVIHKLKKILKSINRINIYIKNKHINRYILEMNKYTIYIKNEQINK